MPLQKPNLELTDNGKFFDILRNVFTQIKLFFKTPDTNHIIFLNSLTADEYDHLYNWFMYNEETSANYMFIRLASVFASSERIDAELFDKLTAIIENSRADLKFSFEREHTNFPQLEVKKAPYGIEDRIIEKYSSYIPYIARLLAEDYKSFDINQLTKQELAEILNYLVELKGATKVFAMAALKIQSEVEASPRRKSQLVRFFKGSLQNLNAQLGIYGIGSYKRPLRSVNADGYYPEDRIYDEGYGNES